MLTLRELIGDLDVTLVAGERNADIPVRWVHISELLDPTPWLSGGELLLTTGMQLDSPERQREFVGRLADHQLTGLGLGTGFLHDEVPAALREAAEERDFPLFEVPYEVPFIAITERAFTRLVNEQYAVLQRAIAAHERLERIVLSERGLDAMAGAIATLVGGTVLVLDPRGEPLAHRSFRRDLDAETLEALREELRARARTGERRAYVPDHAELGGRALVLPVAATGTADRNGAMPQAWLVAAKDAGGLSELDRLTLHQSVSAVALELLRRRVAEDTERRLAGDVLSAIVSGELAGTELVRRLAPFRLAGQIAAIVVSAPDASPEDVESALEAAVRDEAATGLVAAYDSLGCALVAGVADDELFAFAQRLVDRVAHGLGVPARAAAGRAVPVAEARRAFHEARCALEARALTGGNGAGGVATYRDLGSFQLLLSLQDDENLRLFCDSILGPIDSDEGHYGGELMRSLEAFIEENGQWERAAKRLYCHRHTLRYRIRKVEELTGRDLSSARDRIEFWLALRGRELVS